MTLGEEPIEDLAWLTKMADTQISLSLPHLSTINTREEALLFVILSTVRKNFSIS